MVDVTLAVAGETIAEEGFGSTPISIKLPSSTPFVLIVLLLKRSSSSAGTV